MESKPLVSLLIPAYNHEKYIDDIMQSIMNQKYNNLEVFITDDCSIDNTFEKVCSWKALLNEKYQSVQIIRNEKNQGIVKTLNSMLKESTGKYIKPIASDDFLLPNTIEQLVEHLEMNPQYDLVFSNGIIIDENTHYPIKDNESYELYYSEKPIFEGNVVEKMYTKYFLFSPSIMYTRRAYQKIGEYDESIWFEDWDYYLRIAEEMKISYLDMAVIAYRITSSSASHSPRLEYRMGMRRSEIMVLLKHKGFVESELSERMLYAKCNEVFKEAFDMRSKEYMNEIFSLMRNYSVKRTNRNKFLGIIYKLHLVDFLFS